MDETVNDCADSFNFSNSMTSGGCVTVVGAQNQLINQLHKT